MLLSKLVPYLNNASEGQQYTTFEHHSHDFLKWCSTPKNILRVIPLRKYNLQFINFTSTRKSDVHTVELLEFAVAQFSWYSWVALPNEFTFSTKTNLEELSFLLKLKTGASTKQHPQE